MISKSSGIVLLAACYILFTTVAGSLVAIPNPEKTAKTFYTDTDEDAVKSWADAMDFCQRLNMTPARIDNVEENTLVTNFLNDTFTTNKWFWLGAIDIGQETEYYWIPSGERLSYSNWAGSQTEFRTSYNCATIDAITNGQWFVQYCHISETVWKPRPLCVLYDV